MTTTSCEGLVLEARSTLLAIRAYGAAAWRWDGLKLEEQEDPPPKNVTSLPYVLVKVDFARLCTSEGIQLLIIMTRHASISYPFVT